jgi:hypothetical protein
MKLLRSSGPDGSGPDGGLGLGPANAAASAASRLCRPSGVMGGIFPSGGSTISDVRLSISLTAPTPLPVAFRFLYTPEKEIVSSSGVAVHVAPEEPRRVLPQRSHFLVGQESFSFERLRPFQRSGVVVQPDALKIRPTVRCPWRSPWFRCLGPRARSLTGGSYRRKPDEHDHQSAQ